MKKFAVSMQFGHFVQVWEVEAESKEDAWNRARSHGKLQYQTMYQDIYPARDYVTCLDDDKESNTISKELYEEWLKEAFELGMTVDGYCGLPFNNVT